MIAIVSATFVALLIAVWCGMFGCILWFSGDNFGKWLMIISACIFMVILLVVFIFWRLFAYILWL